MREQKMRVAQDVTHAATETGALCSMSLRTPDVLCEMRGLLLFLGLLPLGRRSCSNSNNHLDCRWSGEIRRDRYQPATDVGPTRRLQCTASTSHRTVSVDGLTQPSSQGSLLAVLALMSVAPHFGAVEGETKRRRKEKLDFAKFFLPSLIGGHQNDGQQNGDDHKSSVAFHSSDGALAPRAYWLANQRANCSLCLLLHESPDFKQTRL